MDERHIQTAPVWLIAVAASTLAACLLVTRGALAPAARTPIDEPARTTAPLRWRVAALEPLRVSEPVESAVAFGDATVAILVRPPVTAPLLGELTEFGPSESDLLAATPLELRQADQATPEASAAERTDWSDRLIVLLPSESRIGAGLRARVVLSPPMRAAWSIAGFDTLQSARAAGKTFAAPTAPRTTWSAQVAGRWLRRALAALPPAEAPRLAAVAPRLAATKVYRVVPVTPIEVAPSKRPARPLSIAEYLRRGVDAESAYPVAEALGEQLDRVAADRASAPWAWAVAYRLRTIAAEPAGSHAAKHAMARLDEACDEAFVLAEGVGDAATATELRRAAYGLTRRLATWRSEETQVLALLQRRVPVQQRLEAARWAMSLEAVGASVGGMLYDANERPVLRVARRLEEYERAPSARLASTLAADAERLMAIRQPESLALGTAIEQNYRNANVRVAIASGLIERLLPKPEPVTAPVRGRIAGTPVSGRSTTRSDVSVLLAPDAAAWRIGLEAHGVVESRTYSRGGPALLGAVGSTSFTAKKLVVLTPEGLRAAPAVVEAATPSQRLVSLKTDYDRVPLVGDMVRSTARDEYGRMRSRAKAETRQRVERQVRVGMDERVDPSLAQIEQRFATEVTQRVARLGLKVEPIEMRTTADRLITRVRLASDRQLAAHTPRMRAPSDSLLSVQLHESMLNNALAGLGLAGETLTTDQLRDRLVERLQLPSRQLPATREQATLRFAADEPIRFDLAEGRAELTLAIDALAVRGRRHDDFKVHAFYKPEVNGLLAELVQDGSPHIEGRMRTASRMHLHGVMSRVLAAGERVPLVRVTDQTPERLANALVGLATNQFVIEDGWLGLSVGPPRPTKRLALQIGGYVR